MQTSKFFGSLLIVFGIVGSNVLAGDSALPSNKDLGVAATTVATKVPAKIESKSVVAKAPVVAKSKQSEVGQQLAKSEAKTPAAIVVEKKFIGFQDGDTLAELRLRAVIDGFYGKHMQLFSPSDLDQIFYSRSTWDAIFAAEFNKWLSTKISIRNKATWGDEESILTTSVSPIKIGDSVTGHHTHTIGKLVPWIKEAWVNFSVNKAFGLNDSLQHQLKFGALPFSLGRGVSLGTAYAASDGILGFYSSGVVDQYAFGSLLSGEIKPGRLTYNFYVGCLENYADKFGRVNSPIYANEIGSRDTPERGFGHINFVIATNLKWSLLDGTAGLGKLTVEPYILYNRSPEQRVEFTADASSSLATLGLSGDYIGSRFEWGFDMGANFGSQTVLAWDRNQVVLLRNSDGVIKNFYNYVKSGSSTGPNAVETDGVRNLVNSAPQSPALNGAFIGTVDGVNYYNAENRFRPRYSNKYKGLMFVSDASWSLREDKKLKFAGTFGWATGDENPNQNLTDLHDAEVDGDYQGFIGLQTDYSGKRVPSLFVFGMFDIPRPLTAPQRSSTDPNRSFATDVSKFTNLMFIGGGIDWQVKAFSRGWRVKLNSLSYWQDKATKKYDAATQQSLDEYANRHLGTEFSGSLRLNLINGLAGFFTGGVFVPGQHYEDIKGKPLNSAQLRALSRRDSSGYPVNGTPVIGTSTAIVLNWGLEINF